MAFPCCMGLNNGVRFAALLSVVLALGLGGVSGWLFKDTYELRNSDAIKARDAGVGVLNSVFGATGIEKIDLDKVLRIKMACSGTVFGAAVLQLITSLLLLCCSATKGGRSTAKLYIFINTWVIVAVAAAAACFFTAEGIDYKEDSQIQYFLGASAADLVFLLYLLCVAGAFART